MLVGDVGRAEDSGTIQTNIVRIDGQRSVYVPVLKQGGDSNTITIVNGMKAAIKNLVDIPASLKTAVVFDQSVFVKSALKNLGSEGGIGLVLTALMILLFLGSVRATFAVLFRFRCLRSQLSSAFAWAADRSTPWFLPASRWLFRA